jgi:hypothetical protein
MPWNANSVAAADTVVVCMLLLALASGTLAYYAADDALIAVRAFAAEHGAAAAVALAPPLRIAVGTTLCTLVAVTLSLMVVARAYIVDGRQRAAAMAVATAARKTQ